MRGSHQSGKSIARMTLGMLGVYLGVTAAVAQPIKKGEVFPNFSEYDAVTNKLIKLEDFRGKVVLIDFWATWCGPCIKELPNVKKAYKKYHKRGFEIISISLDGSVDKCKKYVKSNDMNWHHVADGKGWRAKLAQKHGVESIPRAVVIGKDGKVISENARGDELEKAIEKGLKQEYTPEKEPTDPLEIEARKKLAEADRLRSMGEYEGALRLYDEIGVKYPTRPTAKVANERARLIREDPRIQQQIKQSKSDAYEREARDFAKRWMKVGDQMAKAGKHDLAKRYYKRIVDKYPDSEVGKQAQAKIDKLPG